MKQNKINKEMSYYLYIHNIYLYQYHDTKSNPINIDWLLGLTPTKTYKANSSLSKYFKQYRSLTQRALGSNVILENKTNIFETSVIRENEQINKARSDNHEGCTMSAARRPIAIKESLKITRSYRPRRFQHGCHHHVETQSSHSQLTSESGAHPHGTPHWDSSL